MRRYEVRVIGPELDKVDKIRADSLSHISGKVFVRYPEARTAIVSFRGKKFEYRNPAFEPKKEKKVEPSKLTFIDSVHGGLAVHTSAEPKPECPACEAGVPALEYKFDGAREIFNVQGTQTGRMQCSEPNLPEVPRAEHHDEELIPGTGGV